MTKNENTADDITHDIFARIWIKRNSVSAVRSFSSYLFRMIRNAVMDYYESNAVSSRYIAHRSICGTGISEETEEKIDLDDLELIIYNAVKAMPERRRRIFTLSRYEGLSNSEIARLSGINIRTVENHITNALADIRTALARI